MRTQSKPPKQVEIAEEISTLSYEAIIKELSKQLISSYLPTDQSSHMFLSFPKNSVSTPSEKIYWPPEKRKVESDEAFYLLKEKPKPTQLSLTKIMEILGNPIDEVSPINEEKEWVVVSPKNAR